MPAQSGYRIPTSLAARNLTADQLRLDDVIEIIDGGPTKAQTLLGNLAFVMLGEVVVVVAAGDYDVPSVARITVVMNKTAAQVTEITLPPAADFPAAGAQFGYPLVTVKDGKGDSATYPITVTTGDGKTIDGAASVVIQSDYAGYSFQYNGTQWNVF